MKTGNAEVKTITVRNSSVTIWRMSEDYEDSTRRTYEPTKSSWGRIEDLLDSDMITFDTSVLRAKGDTAFLFVWEC